MNPGAGRPGSNIDGVVAADSSNDMPRQGNQHATTQRTVTVREDNLLLSQLPGDQVGNSEYNEVMHSATEKRASPPRDSIEKESVSGHE